MPIQPRTERPRYLREDLNRPTDIARSFTRNLRVIPSKVGRDVRARAHDHLLGNARRYEGVEF